ncbi:hypothetical protein FOA52_011612 [Chlamydomonas sp. UWO 241]|nr:hypothetical protein FOA52_011612 [Chlamydomonas sp. UWO 241]
MLVLEGCGGLQEGGVRPRRPARDRVVRQAALALACARGAQRPRDAMSNCAIEQRGGSAERRERSGEGAEGVCLRVRLGARLKDAAGAGADRDHVGAHAREFGVHGGRAGGSRRGCGTRGKRRGRGAGAESLRMQTRSVRASRAPAVRATASMQKVAKFAGVAVSTLALTFAANADVNVNLGSSTGALVFEPSTINAKVGEKINFVNNAGFPHNIVFDEDEVPAGVDADALSREELLNAPGEKYSVSLTKPGTYGIYCEPHQGAGMVGKIIVS